MPWFQGDGAHYLYLAGQDQTQAFGVDYFTTVSPYRLAGVTAPVETRRTVPELYGTALVRQPGGAASPPPRSRRTPTSTSRAAPTPSPAAPASARTARPGWSSPTTPPTPRSRPGELPDDFVAYRERPRHQVVVHARRRDRGARRGRRRRRAGRAVTTTVDTPDRRARRRRSPSPGGLRDGAPWPGTGTAPLGLAAVRRRRRRAPRSATSSWTRRQARPRRRARHGDPQPPRSSALSNPDTPVTKQVFSLSVDQAAGAPPASMAYALVPNATGAAAARRTPDGPLSVLANTTAVQAVAHTAASACSPPTPSPPARHHAGRLSIDGPASVILREARDGTCSIAVSDPTTNRDTVSVTVRGRALRAARRRRRRPRPPGARRHPDRASRPATPTGVASPPPCADEPGMSTAGGHAYDGRTQTCAVRLLVRLLLGHINQESRHSVA